MSLNASQVKSWADNDNVHSIKLIYIITSVPVYPWILMLWIFGNVYPTFPFSQNYLTNGLFHEDQQFVLKMEQSR